MDGEQEKINRYWSEDAGVYERVIRDELDSFRPAAWTKKIEEQVGGRKGLKVLDCGCGPAFFTIILSRAGHDVTGIDAAEGMLRVAEKNLASLNVRATLLQMDCHELSFPDGSFDLVLSRNVTHTLRDHVRVYRQWQRVLKPGGVLLIFDANWHLPTVSESVLWETLLREKHCIEIYGSDFSGNTSFDEERSRSMYKNEKRYLPGDVRRPDWDCGILTALGFREISYERDVTGPLWDDKEKLIYGNTPMFMIRAVK